MKTESSVKDLHPSASITVFGCTISILCGITLVGDNAWLPSYLKSARGFSWAVHGRLVVPAFVIATASVFLFEHLGDKIGRRAPFVAVSPSWRQQTEFLGANVYR